MAFTESYLPVTAPYRASSSADIVQSWLLGQMVLWVVQDNGVKGSFFGNECDHCKPLKGILGATLG